MNEKLIEKRIKTVAIVFVVLFAFLLYHLADLMGTLPYFMKTLYAQ